MSFYSETRIASVRKSRPCHGCGRRLEIGSPAIRCAGVWEGDFWSGAYHTDCREAEIAVNILSDTNREGEFYPLCEIDSEDWRWLLAEFPAVAARMGITAHRCEEIENRPVFFGKRPA